MGYPMTYSRVVKRNRLTEGAYGETGPDWFGSGTAVAWDSIGSDLEVLRAMGERVVSNHNERAKEYNQRVANLMGDLRRLERDTVDERATCLHIAHATGVDADSVAAVLAEFIRW